MGGEGDLHSEVKVFDTKDEAGELSQAVHNLVTGVNVILTDQARVLNAMADGDLTQKLEAPYAGDFMQLRDSVEAMKKSLNETLGQINESTEQVATGADQVSQGAQSLSQGTTEQAGAIEELAATVAEIADGSKENAENARAASDKVGEVGSELKESQEKMADMVSAMQEITNTSNEIGKIIKTIEDIAFQTNILALNAAVEAARAGAAGQGFAVVADEVRNLASKSSEASKNSAALIEQSLRAVENGSQIASQTAGALDGAVDGAQKVIDRIDAINNASNTQSSAVEQVRVGMDQISTVVQTNSATSEESAAASEELSGQAQLMKELVSRFKLQGYNRKDVMYSDNEREAMDDLGDRDMVSDNKY